MPEAARPRTKAPRRPPLRETLTLAAIRAGFATGSWVAPDLTAKQALRLFIRPNRIGRPGWEEDLLASARIQTLRSGLMTYTWGSGPRVLLVHGWDGRGTQMGRIAQALVAAGYEAIAIDLPAHGQSPGQETHVPDAKEALLGASEELGPLHAVVAHSFGAAASLYATYHGLETKKLVYIAGPNRFTDLFDRYMDFVGVRGTARERFLARVEKLVDIDPRENYPGAWAPKIDAQALVIHDRDDDDVPFADAEALLSEWKSADFLITRGLGHRRILKSPEVMASIVGFLRSPN